MDLRVNQSQQRRRDLFSASLATVKQALRTKVYFMQTDDELYKSEVNTMKTLYGQNSPSFCSESRPPVGALSVWMIIA